MKKPNFWAKYKNREKTKNLDFTRFLICFALVFSLITPINMFAEQDEQTPLTLPKPSVGINDTYSLAPGALPCVGSPKVVVFVVDFLNDTPGDWEGMSVSDIEKKFFADMDSTSPNGKNYENESLRSFYYRSSYGKVDITGDIFAYTTKKPKQEYASLNLWTKS